MICEDCGEELVNDAILVELAGEAGATELNISFCASCKIIGDISIDGFVIR